jgi:uncharacterized protein (DUF2141 family)
LPTIKTIFLLKIQNYLLTILTFLTTTLLSAQELKVVINNVKDEQGILWVALYDSKDHFMKEQFKFVKLQPAKGKLVAIFPDLAPGTYAISVMHDSNSNKVLDKNGLGMPKEGFGFSNDAMGTFGPPDFKAASFEHSSPKELVINLKYW